MKVLSLGLDNSVLNQQSALAGRIVEYGRLVDKYFVVVPNKIKQEIELSKNVKAFGAGGKNKLFQLFNIYKKALELINKEGFDVITVQDQYYLALVGCFLKKKFKIGLEIQVHGFEKFAGLRKMIAKFVLPKADIVRTVSQRTKRQLIKDFDIKEEKITVVPIYSETPTSSLLARWRERGGDKFVFLSVGRLVPVKNIEMQIDVIGEIINNKKISNKQKIELWIIGDGPERDNLKFKIQNLKLEENVKLLGYKDNLVEFYGSADCFMLTSDYEGWGLAVIEAAAYGLPIIMTDVGCAGEVIKNNESGLVIPVGDKEKLIEAMTGLIKNKDLREKLGENARKAVEKLPSKEETMRLYLESWKKADNKSYEL